MDVLAAIAALAVAAIALGLYGYHPSQYTFIDEDPGSYSSTARWIARDGSLRDDAAVGPFKGAPNLVFQTAAVFDTGGGHLEFQFNHLASVAMAFAFGVGGQRGLYRLAALSTALALLPLYVLGCRLLRRPWLAVVVAATLAGSLPFIWIGRGTYSEPFTLLPLMAALVALCWLWERPRVGTAVLAGALVGTTLMARIDGVAYLFPLMPFAALLWARKQRSAVVGLLVAAAVPALIGALDLRYLTGPYGKALAHDRSALEHVLLLLAVVSAVAVAASGPVRRLWGRVGRSRAGVVAGGLTSAGFLAGWLAAPHPVHGPRTEQPLHRPAPVEAGPHHRRHPAPTPSTRCAGSAGTSDRRRWCWRRSVAACWSGGCCRGGARWPTHSSPATSGSPG